MKIKINKIKEERKFVPVKIELTIETLEEAICLWAHANMSGSELEKNVIGSGYKLPDNSYGIFTRQFFDMADNVLKGEIK